MNSNIIRKEAWKKYIDEKIIDSSVNPIIAESWIRCRKNEVNHLEGEGKQVSKIEYEKIIERNEELLKIARPIMKNLHNIVLGTHFVLVLTDKYGHIIETIGDNVVKGEANKIKFNLGSLWDEESVGTNAIGTSLVIDKPIQIIGEEHYCISHHVWTCSATTIHDDAGDIIGCLNMSGDRSKAHSHTLGIVVAAAYTIEEQIALLRSHNLIETMIESTSDGIIIIDNNYKINKVNDRALKILGLKNGDNNKLDIKKIFKDVNFDFNIDNFDKRKTSYFTDCNLCIDERMISCSANIAPMVVNNKTIGFTIVFKETKYLHKTVNKVTGNTATYIFKNIISEDINMKKTIHLAKKMARTNSSILIEGESGTGKELFAHAIHNYSGRLKGPFVAVNCASLPRGLIESELFGYEKGSFTGALKEGNPGKFELADGGTIFLDEIGELPLELQSKLLRVLDSLTIRRIGGKYEKKLDVRIIAATNRNLFEEVKRKNFRKDLYYRLNVFKLGIPPLRDRIGDVKLCANHFLQKMNYQRTQSDKVFSQEFINCLENYIWVGNIRELQNSIERSYYLCDEKIITKEYLPEMILNFNNIEKNENKFNIKNKIDNEIVSIEIIEKNNIMKMLMKCNNNVIQTGNNLNMSKSTIYRKIKKYNINISKGNVG